MSSTYLSGIGSNNNFSLLVSGRGDYASSGIMIKNDTSAAGSGHAGLAITHSASDNASIDFRTTKNAGKALKVRIQDDAKADNYSELMTLTDDDKSSTGTFGAVIGGRVKASQLATGEADTRAPVAPGVYLGHDSGNTGYIKINRGTGIGGFSFQTYNANGTLSKTNMELSNYGYVTMPEYKSSGDAMDTEALAIASFDSTGKLVRDYRQNARFRSIEERTASVEEDSAINIPTGINQVIRRMNSLEYFSQPIAELSLGVVSQAPVAYSGEIQLAVTVDATTVETSVWQTSFLQAISDSTGVPVSALSISAVSSGPAMSATFRSGSAVVVYVVVKVTASSSVDSQSVMEQIKEQSRDSQSVLVQKMATRLGSNPVNTSYTPVLRELTPTAPTLNPVPVQPRVTARYIRFEFGGPNNTGFAYRYLHFRTLKVFSSRGGSNVINPSVMTATASEYFMNQAQYAPSNAIDNNDSTIYHSGQYESSPWFQADLKEDTLIYKLEVFNRGSNDERYLGVNIILKAADGSVVWTSSMASTTSSYYSYWPGLSTTTYGSSAPLSDTPPQ